uniref:Small ribosomal subunit protein uS3c n=1 Tax=Caulerpa lentillifera TaxID=148947 RepID=A0A345HGV5_9CHLO|nr:30S ribosomal protein S3 [Caulerpa lentillifera]AXG75845.1 30S ribosomal protein S3 [Caulerpa lentillifera]
MGQKVHPIGFRLGLSQNHSSLWFAQKNHYSQFVLEDHFIRQILLKYSKNIDQIKIIRQYANHIEIIIYTKERKLRHFLGFLSLTEFSNLIKEKIYKYRQSHQTYFGNRNFCKDQKEEPPLLTLRILNLGSQLNGSFIAQFLVDQLEKRTPYRAAINKLYERVLNSKKRSERRSERKDRKKQRFHPKYDGLKIQISGRLNGVEIARSEQVREGRLPLQTLNAHIDYSFKKASTIYGILGVKVWIFKELKKIEEN